MANLSNINGKFVVEQTTGYVGVGTTDPNYPIEVLNASAEIALNATGGSIYRLQSDSTDSFRINKNGVGDRLIIDGSGNSSFKGNITILGNVKKLQWIDTEGNWKIESGNGSNKLVIHSESLVADYLTIKGTGVIQFNDYGAGSNTGTTAYNLAVDSSGNIIETTDGGGTVKGTGTATRVAFWSASDTITSDADLYWDNTNKRLGIGTASPSFQLSIENHDTTTSTATFEIDGKRTNGTDGAVGEMIFSNNGDTFATVAGFRDGADNKGSLQFQTQDSTFATRMTISSEGNVGIATTSPTVKLDISGSSGGASVRIKDNMGAGAYYYGYMYDGGNLQGTTQTNIFYAGGSVAANTTITDYASLRIDTPNVAATNATVTNNYGIYQGSNLQRNFFNGNVGVGTSSPGDVRLFVENPSGSTNPVFETRLDTTYNMGISNRWVSATVSKLKIGRSGTAPQEISSMDFIYDIAGAEYGSIKRNFVQASLKFERSTNTDMIINGSGNVGIGTTLPTARLKVIGVNDAWTCQIENTQALPYGLSVNTAGTAGTTFNSAFYTHSGLGMYIVNNGKVGIGTTNPLSKLTVSEGTNQHGIELAPGTLSYLQCYDRATSDYGNMTIDAKYLAFGLDNGAEKIRFTADGKVGIGTTLPESLLHIKGETKAYISFQDTTDGYLGFVGDAANMLTSGTVDNLGLRGEGGIQFGVSDVIKMVLNSSGNVGIGTTSPTSAKLVVAGDIDVWNSTNTLLRSSHNGSYGSLQTFTGGAYGILALNPGGGTVGIGTTSPNSYDGESNNLVIAEGVNGTNPTPGITIACLANQAATGRGALRFADGTTGNEKYRGALEYNHSGDDMFFRTAGTVKMTLDDIGNLGIGTTSPGRGLTIDKSEANAALTIIKNNTGNEIVYLGTGSSAGTDDPLLRMYHNGTENIRLYATGDSWINGGNVGIGNTSPAVTLDVTGNVRVTDRLGVGTMPDTAAAGDRLKIQGGNNGLGCIIAISGQYSYGVRIEGSNLSTQLACYSSSTALTTQINFSNPGNSSAGKISTTGNSTAYTTSSDYRLKENVIPISDSIYRLNQLKPSRFNFIGESNKTVDGFIAHEVQDIVPEAIVGEKDEIDKDGNPVHQGIDQAKLVPLLVAAIQELEARVKELENN